MKTCTFRFGPVQRAARAGAVSVLALSFVVALGACGHMQSSATPEPVNELVETAGDGTPTNAFPQYWKRNTLVVDLATAAPSGGTLVLKPREGGKWPVRLAFRVMPGSIGMLEVQADQRLLMPVAREGDKPVDLELVPGVYTASTPQITVRWEAVKPPVS
ncbi:MAG: hypothetical protein IRZ28_04655 [Steroidobacteraceae bacterium]|jgi:hypothetical protein|nr:hypothetical protein [Steroidobacteraceae bacterium]